MSDDKRSPVGPPPIAGDVGPDGLPSEEEVAESKKLREALDRGDDPVALALKAAWEPEPLPAEAHARIVDDATLDDPIVHALRAAWSPAALDDAEHRRIVDDVPTAEELLLAQVVDDDDLVRALKAAWNPGAIDAEEHRRIVVRATTAGAVRPARRRASILLATTTTVFALAASVVLWIATSSPGGPKVEVALAKARSTQPLFDEPFKNGEASARIDRIALARSADYRDNFFARRGVR